MIRGGRTDRENPTVPPCFVEAGQEKIEAVKRTVDGDEKVELTQLREENESLKKSMAAAVDVIQEVENLRQTVNEGRQKIAEESKRLD